MMILIISFFVGFGYTHDTNNNIEQILLESMKRQKHKIDSLKIELTNRKPCIDSVRQITSVYDDFDYEY